MIEGARKLPVHHITIRVPWHDDGWRGTVCKKPSENTQCLILKRIGTSKRDAHELGCAGKRFDELAHDNVPPCIDERAGILAPFEIRRTKVHPYGSWSDLHQHFAETELRVPAWSAACVPFRWMLREVVEGKKQTKAQPEVPGLADLLQLGYSPDHEDEIAETVKTVWVQHRDNQLALLDTFFGAIAPETSLCFFYAKRTPLSEDPRRVIVGVGRVKSLGTPTEYAYNVKNPPLRGVLWERSVTHSVRPDSDDGFMFPYAELLDAASSDPSIALEEYAAFAPDDQFERFSYGCEHLPHDGAVASLIACVAAYRKMREILPSLSDKPLTWMDRELNRLWKARGAFPGLGSALCAFGLRHGTLVAYDITSRQQAANREWTDNPWKLVDEAMNDPTKLSPGVRDGIEGTYRKKWKALTPDERALLELLSRFELSADQAARFYRKDSREVAGIQLATDDILANPYRIYEVDRDAPDAVTFATIDRGMFPTPAVRKAFPIPPPSTVIEDIDPRRVRAAVIDTLERAAETEGSTVLPRDWVVSRIAAMRLEPQCPLDDAALRIAEEDLGGLVVRTDDAGLQGLQLDRYANARSLIAKAVNDRVRKGKRHVSSHAWSALVDKHVGPAPAKTDEAELRARREKSEALAEIYASRFSVLIGPAGTGKTTLLKALASLADITARGLLLLAPTGKARVRLEERTGRRGDGQTVAQFLLGLDRYDGLTGRYFSNPDAPKADSYKTVIVDEASMLTEDQLAALFDALRGVERIILVGDPRQLPPIGAGRPFVDIVRELAPDDVDTRFPRIAPGYAELTVPRRQKGEDGTLLAAHFSGRPLDAGADEIWPVVLGGKSDEVRVVRWETMQELQEKLMTELVAAVGELVPSEIDAGELDLDEVRFEVSLGGSLWEGRPYFWAENKKKGTVGAASKAEAWQILSPVRGTLAGVDSLNRVIQERFRTRAKEMATKDGRFRKVPRPLGSQSILWGDKVINLQNKKGRRRYPDDAPGYVANGDIGIVVGEWAYKGAKKAPKHLEVELTSQCGTKFTYYKGEFGEDGAAPLELAYALTVHKTQGSEFGRTFLVLPNPCRLLSRELLYTALTRHVDRLTILVQGDPRRMLVYGHDDRSEIARRMTNLFRPPNPCAVESAGRKMFLERALIHRTSRGEYVQSKSEVVIANLLHQHGVDYAYEKPLRLDVERYPDFTIEDDATGMTYYWEHCGMLDVQSYRARWERKLAAYRTAGILPREEKGGPNGTLIITDELTGLDTQSLEKIVREIKG